MDGEDVLLRSPIVGDWMLAAAMTKCGAAATMTTMPEAQVQNSALTFFSSLHTTHDCAQLLLCYACESQRRVVMER
jgi:hypothetical protein